MLRPKCRRIFLSSYREAKLNHALEEKYKNTSFPGTGFALSVACPSPLPSPTPPIRSTGLLAPSAASFQCSKSLIAPSKAVLRPCYPALRPSNFGLRCSKSVPRRSSSVLSRSQFVLQCSNFVSRWYPKYFISARGHVSPAAPVRASPSRFASGAAGPLAAAAGRPATP